MFRGFIDKIIKSEIPLRDGSTVTEAWMHPPVRPLLQVRLLILSLVLVVDQLVVGLDLVIFENGCS